MKKQRFTEEQIIAVLKEQEAGAKAADLCRKHGISEATFYNWKAKYGGMEVSEAKRLAHTYALGQVAVRPRLIRKQAEIDTSLEALRRIDARGACGARRSPRDRRHRPVGGA